MNEMEDLFLKWLHFRYLFFFFFILLYGWRDEKSEVHQPRQKIPDACVCVSVCTCIYSMYLCVCACMSINGLAISYQSQFVQFTAFTMGLFLLLFLSFFLYCLVCLAMIAVRLRDVSGG